MGRNHMSRNRYPRETVEFTPITVTVDGVPVVDDVEIAITPMGERPTTWQPAPVLGGRIGVMISALDPGWHTAWARVASSPETPVIELDSFEIT
jgi:hypothetical protein